MGTSSATAGLGAGAAAGAAVGLMGGPFGAIAGAGVGMAIGGVLDGNRSIKAANAAALKAHLSNKAYIEVSRQSEQSKLGKSYAKYVAREAALSSSRGTLGSASSTAAQMSALANALTDSGVIDFNARAQKNQSANTIGNQIRQNSSNFSNPLIAGVSSGAQWAVTGYQLGNILKEYYGQ
jgi:hypothetical protein